MIGKFLEEENAADDSAARNLETESRTPAENNASGNIFKLPETEAGNAPQTSAENPVFRETGDVIDAVPLPENQPVYTIAPPEAVASAAPFELKPEDRRETAGEDLRRSGMAWSAATVLIGSVVFMLIIGWFFDLVFGSTPWGIVFGIVLGAIIGFVQFFRITSQIFKNDDDNNNSLGFK